MPRKGQLLPLEKLEEIQFGAIKTKYLGTLELNYKKRRVGRSGTVQKFYQKICPICNKIIWSSYGNLKNSKSLLCPRCNLIKNGQAHKDKIRAQRGIEKDMEINHPTLGVLKLKSKMIPQEKTKNATRQRFQRRYCFNCSECGREKLFRKDSLIKRTHIRCNHCDEKFRDHYRLTKHDLSQVWEEELNTKHLGKYKTKVKWQYKRGGNLKVALIKCRECGNEKWLEKWFIINQYKSQLCKKCSRKRTGALNIRQAIKTAHLRVGKLNHNWKGGSVNENGYRIISISKKDPYACCACNMNTSKNRCSILEHRYKMCQKIGRPLLPEEQIHHMDHNPLNNSIENLELISPRAHRSYSMMKQYINKLEKIIVDGGLKIPENSYFRVEGNNNG